MESDKSAVQKREERTERKRERIRDREQMRLCGCVRESE